jgi:RNA polymerase sigma factor (sigma-70 family)
MSESSHKPDNRGSFPKTQWSIVLAAGRRSTPHSQQALASLCENYWYPLYAYVRRRGYDAEEARELTQEFFTKLLEKNYLQDVDRERGRFRSFLLTSLKHFLANQYDRDQAQKRGGGQSAIPLDIENAESRYRLEPGHNLTPEKIYERRWALTLLERVLAKLRAEQAAAGQPERFDCLKEFLTGKSGTLTYSQVAEQLQMTEGAVKVAVHRLRRRYGEILRAEISQTVADPSDVEGEIRGLFSALAH